MLVDTIFQQKVMEIQSRLPVAIHQVQVQEKINFEPLLNQKIKTVQDKSSTLKDLSKTGELTKTLSDNKFSNHIKQDKPIMSQIEAAIEEASYKHKVPAALIKAMIRQESNFNPKSISSVGAIGLMQLMPNTAEGLGVSDPFDIRQNIDGGTKYLKGLLARFNSDYSLAIAAYNAGPNAVKKYGGVPPYEETQNHVRKVLKYYHEYKYDYAQK